MSSTIAKDTLVETFKNLLTCDENVKKDFVIESKDRDGEKALLHVHSSILTMRFDLFWSESFFTEKKQVRNIQHYD